MWSTIHYASSVRKRPTCPGVMKPVLLVGDFFYTVRFEMNGGTCSMTSDADPFPPLQTWCGRGKVIYSFWTSIDADTMKKDNLQVIHQKTAKLFWGRGQLRLLSSEGIGWIWNRRWLNMPCSLASAFPAVDEFTRLQCIQWKPLVKTIGDWFWLRQTDFNRWFYAIAEIGTAEQSAIIRKAIEQGASAIKSMTYWNRFHSHRLHWLYCLSAQQEAETG